MKSDMKKIGQTAEILVVYVDQQKYEQYLSSAVNPTKMWHDRRINTRTNKLDDGETPIKWGLHTSMVSKPSEQEISLPVVGESAVLTTDEPISRSTRTQIWHRNS